MGALLLSACYPEQGLETGVSNLKRNEVHLIRYTHDVNMGTGTEMLPGAEAARLDAFLSLVGVRYGDRIIIDPGAGNGGLARSGLLRRHLLDSGLRAESRSGLYGAPPEAGHARILIERWAVETPQCHSDRASGANWANAPSPTFGCASQAMLGLMVADPSHLTNPADLAPVYSEAATAALARYREALSSGESVGITMSINGLESLTSGN